MRYRSFFYCEFHPRDFVQHFHAANIRPPEPGKGFVTWEEWMIDYQQKLIAKTWFGPGIFEEVMIAEIKGNEHGIYFLKGYYYFDSLDFSNEQKETQAKAGPGPFANGLWYEETTQTEAA